MIKRSNNIKHIKSFEFDAFLCNYSCLRPLSYVFKRLRMTNSLKVVVRRVDKFNECNLLEPFLGRMRRTKKIKFQFPSTEKIDAMALGSLSKGLFKCYSIEAISLDFTFLPLVPTEGFMFYSRFGQRFRNLKIFSFKKLLCPLKNAFPIEVKKSKRALYNNLESVSMYKGLKSGWVQRTTTEIEELPGYITGYGSFLKLRNFSFHFHRFQLTPEIVIAFGLALPNLPLLENVSLEFVCCGLGDIELGISAQIIQRFTQIKSYTYKVTQRPNVNEDQAINFANSLAKMNNLEKFNVIFRGTAFVNAGELTDELSRMKNMNFNLTKNSVHLYKDNINTLSILNM